MHPSWQCKHTTGHGRVQTRYCTLCLGQRSASLVGIFLSRYIIGCSIRYVARAQGNVIHHRPVPHSARWSEMAHLRIKICGVTTPEDAHQAALLGADAVGLNFYPPSLRYLTPAAVPALLKALPPFVEAVGVFVGQRLQQMFDVVNPFGRIRTLQWHGERHEAGRTFPFRLIAAFPVRDRDSLDEIRRYLDQCRAIDELPAAILVDAHVAGQFGGTGRPAPWNLLADFRPGVPLILAGGLTPDNVAEAVRVVRPYAVDVASGVESGPGRKDPEKMRRFIMAARAAAAE
jgi:phosphoribosylanthranilate isomerase